MIPLESGSQATSGTQPVPVVSARTAAARSSRVFIGSGLRSRFGAGAADRRAGDGGRESPGGGYTRGPAVGFVRIRARVRGPTAWTSPAGRIDSLRRIPGPTRGGRPRGEDDQTTRSEGTRDEEGC